MNYDYDYIVIGSGFGGSVSALRLAEKGYTVAVLEMGKRFNAEDFPKSTWQTKKHIWMPKFKLYGFFQMTWLKDVLIFHGAGVGGGSLVYANTLLVPPPKAFEDPRWPDDDPWEQKLAPFYDLAKFMLGATVAKNIYPSDEALRELVDEDMGCGNTFKKHTVGVYFGESGKDAEDPYFGGEGPARTGCIECGACMIGCRYNAKNTLDKNYIHLAENRGAEIIPETRVTDIKPLEEGGYEIHTEQSTRIFNKPKRTLRAKGVVVSASVLGTVGLLSKCKENGSLPNITDRLGDYVRTNNEAILSVSARGKEVDYGRGIAITSGVHPDENTHVEMVRYGSNADSMMGLMTLLTGAGKPWPRWLRLLGNIARHPLRFLSTLFLFGRSRKTNIVLVMQPITSHLKLRLKNKLWGRTIDTELTPGQDVPKYMPLANEITEKLANKMDGTPHSLNLEVIGNTCSTAHILGGATMGRSPEEGVCDHKGRVYGYDNLYVADGSIVPANLGVNPSLTITALSEYVMSHIPVNPDGEEKPAPRPKTSAITPVQAE
jgi:cholesterol oxidase